jgi:hypothetical protein
LFIILNGFFKPIRRLKFYKPKVLKGLEKCKNPLELYVVTHQQSFARVKNPNCEGGFDSSNVELPRKFLGFCFMQKHFFVLLMSYQY